MILWAPFAQAASNPAYLNSLKEKIVREHLGNERAWRKVMLMPEPRYGIAHSLEDDPRFFMSPHGQTEPEAEMIASLERFAQPQVMTIGSETKHPQCFFAARFDYLKTRLHLDPARYPIESCPDLDKFLRFATYSGVSLVFSNYFAGNPASMFGHTLLRLHRAKDQKEAGLLDDAFNFAAQVQRMNPLTYPFQGLFGLFKGKFSLVPYSEKIQEYNNFESRDLWEYGLKLSPAEIRRLELEIWEVGSFSMSYYYLQKNCSYIILAFLEAAKPELDLTNEFHVYAIPSDTVKAVVREPGLVTDIQYKPSAQSRYLMRAEALKPPEVQAFKYMIGKFEQTFERADFDKKLGELDVPSRIRLLDALIEFIDFKEKKVSTRKLTKYIGLRAAILLSRSHLGEGSTDLTERPEKSRPDLGPRSSLVEFDSGFAQKGFNISEFRWRPAHHDWASSALGYSDQLEIMVMDTVITRAADLNQFYLKRFTFLELQSLGKQELGLSPLSWRLSLGYNTDRSLNKSSQLNRREEFELGFGKARFWGPFGVYLFLDAAGGYSDDPQLHWHAGLGPQAGAFWNFTDQLRWTTRFTFIKNYGRGSTERRETLSRLAFAFLKENEASLEFRDQDGFASLGAGYRFYF